jgi:hypothetical protein
MCHASLATLMDRTKTVKHQILVGAFLILGLSAIFAVTRVFFIILHKGATVLASDIQKSFASAAIERTIATFLGIAIGAFLLFVTDKLQRRYEA